jgi:Cft2 family RNA processing exonuclease
MVYVTPKRLKLEDSAFKPALVSGWALWSKKKAFPISDHADFPKLIEFVKECRPKIVLTCHGSRFNKTLAAYIERCLRIRAYPINLIPTTLNSRIVKKQVQATLKRGLSTKRK